MFSLEQSLSPPWPWAGQSVLCSLSRVCVWLSQNCGKAGSHWERHLLLSPKGRLEGDRRAGFRCLQCFQELFYAQQRGLRRQWFELCVMCLLEYSAALHPLCLPIVRFSVGILLVDCLYLGLCWGGSTWEWQPQWFSRSPHISCILCLRKERRKSFKRICFGIYSILPLQSLLRLVDMDSGVLVGENVFMLCLFIWGASDISI